MVTAIIQARLGSTRLPGKVLKKISGKPMLEFMIDRLKRSKTIDKIVIATTDSPEDRKIADLAEKIGIDFYRGSETDVLDRYYRAAKKFKANDIIIRLTGDCPLIDPGVVDQVVDFFKKNKKKFDYVSNVRPPTFPDGMDTEVFSFEVLEKAWRLAKLPSEREHVAPYIYNRPKIFRLGNVSYKKDMSHLRLTVDNKEDFLLVSKITELLYERNKNFTLEDILKLLKIHPEIFLINRHISRNEGYSNSLKKEKSIAAVVVLSGGLKKDKSGWRTTNFDEGDNFGVSGDKLRVISASFLYKDKQARLIVVSGGKGQLKDVLPGKITLSSVIKDELVKTGIPAENIIKEEKSGNTYQQLKEIQKILKVNGFKSTVIISNKYHLPRIKAMIKYADNLQTLKKMIDLSRLKIKSAEDIVIKYKPGIWRKLIDKAYKSEAMKKRVALEKRGVRQIKDGTYKFN